MARKTTAAAQVTTTTTRGRGPNGRYISVPADGAAAVAKAPRKPRQQPAAPVTQPPTAAPAVRLKNHVALVLDASSSMGVLRNQMVKTVNSFIDVIKARAMESDQDTTVSLCVFNNEVRHLYVAADARNLQPLRLEEYVPSGMTALFDGVGLTIEKLQALRDAGDPNTSFLILPITDGQENVSRRYSSPRSLLNKLQEVEGDGRWTVAFQVPRGDKAGFCRQFGIPAENVREWETNERGLVETTAATNQGVGGFFDARQQGKKKVERFFTDLSKISDKDIKKQLIDLRKQFRLIQVDRESGIKEFVEAKTGKPYVIGSAYYELTKPETVQPQKDVLIVERGKEKEAIYGGPAARNLLGLPQGEHAKVTPANLSKYRPLIKSTSPNRKLVRGTILALDTYKVVPDQSHFDTSVLDPK